MLVKQHANTEVLFSHRSSALLTLVLSKLSYEITKLNNDILLDSKVLYYNSFVLSASKSFFFQLQSHYRDIGFGYINTLKMAGPLFVIKPDVDMLTMCII